MVIAEKISKSFKLYRDPFDRLKEIIFRRSYHILYKALHDVTFSVKPGETFGIIGRNGAGKSTLLKIISGVLMPDTGFVKVGGRVTGLLELGTGFNPELSGKRNIMINGLLLGMTAEEIKDKEQDIILFSELGDFIYEPLKTYSSGMIMRLAFSIAIHAYPDTFIVDEALAVGDAHFQQKCFKALRDFKESGGSIIFVSHDMNAVKMLCDRVMLLEKGQIIDIGIPEAVVNLYNQLISLTDDQGNVNLLNLERKSDFGNYAAVIKSVSLVGCDSKSSTVSSGESCRISIEYVINSHLPSLTIGILIRDRFGQDVFGTNTYLLDRELPTTKGCWKIDFRIDLNIAPGEYTLSAALHSGPTHLDQCYQWCDHVAHFKVAGIRGPIYVGLCRLCAEVISVVQI